MTKRLSKPQPRDYNLQSFADMVSSEYSGVQEGAENYQAFRSQLLNELRPETPYEFVSVEKLISVEWDLLSARRDVQQALTRYVIRLVEDPYRMARIQGRIRPYGLKSISEVPGALAEEEKEKRFGKEHDICAELSNLRRALNSNDSASLREARDYLQGLNFELSELVTQAWLDPKSGCEFHSASIRTLEIRARTLKADYDKLLGARPIEDAVLLDDN